LDAGDARIRSAYFLISLLMNDVNSALLLPTGSNLSGSPLQR
jgi:hypothetical protein